MIEHELVKQNAETKPCQAEGCTDTGYPCYLPDTRDEPDGYYCSTHAFEHGFCKLCGAFWGGIESFEFLNDGYCDECHDQIRNACGENDDYDGDFDEEDFDE